MAHKLLLLLFWVNFVWSQDVPIVNTTQGLVRGLLASDGDFYEYMGIPYAVVDPRNPFGASSPAPVFEGIFDAIDDSATCPQSEGSDIIGSLDCLHLNVYVPLSASTTNFVPILIFIHGGGFAGGSHGRDLLGPKFLVRHDVIVVTLNYRLGPYGYMCTDNPRVPGNQGSKDQLLALRWVHENIQSFGGDPNKVTLSGSSAGAMATDFQIIRNNDGPKLFQQAILQSGSSLLPDFPKPLRDAPLILSKYFSFQTSDIDEALDFLATVDTSQIIEAVMQLGLEFKSCVERSFDGVEAFSTENWAKKEVIPTVKDLNIMIGFSEYEALGLYVHPDTDFSNVVNEGLVGAYDINHENFTGIEKVRQFFFGDDDIDETKLKEAVDLRSDLVFAYPAMRSINRYLKNDVGKVYLYVFSYTGDRSNLYIPFNNTLQGAVHTDEVGYLWDVSFCGKPSDKDQLIIDRMTTMWTNFVKYGDPTPEQTDLLPVTWKTITLTSPQHYINIGSQLEVGTRPLHRRMAFWDLLHELNKHLETSNNIDIPT